MTSTRLLLIRHAQSAPDDSLPEPEWPLSEEGEQQAIELSRSLAADVLYSSPYLRAVGTLQPTAERLGLSVQTVPDLRERKLSGERQSNWRELLQLSWDDFDRVLPGGESSRDCQTRMLSALNAIAQDNLGRIVAVASHGNAIALFLSHVESKFGFDEWAAMRNPHIFELLYANQSWSLA